jgi:3-oxoacyl-[acyl-carrier-protein] synthase II
VRRRVVVTGLGLVTPHGCEVEEVWRRWCAGDVAVGLPRRAPWSAAGPVRAAAEVPAADVERLLREVDAGEGGSDLRTVFGVAAARRAIEDAGIPAGPHPRAGVAIGSGPGAHRLEDVRAFVLEDGTTDFAGVAAAPERAHAEGIVRNAVDRPATEVARRWSLGGPVLAPTTACTASLHALGAALRLVREGRVDWMLAGGADSMLDPVGLAFFPLLSAAATEEGPRAARPFSRRRTGLVTGEGAGIAVLESLDHARARGARILAELAGFGSTLDAHHPTAPRPDGSGIEKAMAAALADAGLSADEVDAVGAHASGTKRNDPAEAAAIRRLLGARADRVPVTSTKAGTGHLLAAAGAVSFAQAVLAVARSSLPPTAHLDDPDPACALDHVLGAPREGPLRAALVNALAFGGHNASIAVRSLRP